MVNWHKPTVSSLLTKFHLEVVIHVNRELRIKNKKFSLWYQIYIYWNQSSGQFPFLQLAYVLLSYCTALDPSFPRTGKGRQDTTHTSLSFAAAPICYTVFSSLSFLLMGLGSVFLGHPHFFREIGFHSMALGVKLGIWDVSLQCPVSVEEGASLSQHCSKTTSGAFFSSVLAVVHLGLWCITLPLAQSEEFRPLTVRLGVAWWGKSPS